MCYFQNRLFKLLILLLLLIFKIYPIKGFATIYLCFLELKKNPNFLYLEVLNQVMEARKSRFPSLFLSFFSTPQNFFLSKKPHPLKSVLCGSRWASKTPAVPDSYKRCTPWLELETYCADLKLFAITLRPLPSFFSTPQNPNSQFVS